MTFLKREYVLLGRLSHVNALSNKTLTGVCMLKSIITITIECVWTCVLKDNL